MFADSIHNAFINALLADATYVDGLAPGGVPLTGGALVGALSNRLTPDLANYLASHFEVVQQLLTSDTTQSGLDVTVFRSKDTGQVYVSCRGTEGLADFVADADLSTTGLARAQVVDLVNWWIRSTTPAGTACAQIKLQTTTNEDTGIASTKIVAADAVIGDGTLTGFSSVVVNGHSLGGHLATAFTRIFGDLVSHTYTYNSATFNPFSPLSFGEIDAALRQSLSTFPSNGKQTNFFAEHGPDLTTQNVTQGQIGLRVGLFNEESLNALTVPNHFMYKLTDALALGEFLGNLDASFGIDKLNSLYEVASANRNDALEKALDGLNHILHADKSRLTVGDSGDSVVSRVEFHKSLTALNGSFSALSGHVGVELSSGFLKTKARDDFSALASLMSLSPVYLKGADSTLNGVLQSAWGSTYTDWENDKNLSQADKKAGKATITESYLAARTEMLEWLIQFNSRNVGYDQRLNSIGGLFPTPVIGDYIYQDVSFGLNLDIDGVNLAGGTHYVRFGADGTDELNGGAIEDRLYGGSGNDILWGFAENDYLEGNSGNDSLFGGDDGDTLMGGAGNDTLVGGDGDDSLNGGGNDDVYRFSGDFGRDVIVDSGGADTLDVTGFLGGLPQGKKIHDGLYRSEDKKVSYLIQTEGEGANKVTNLTINFADEDANQIIIRNWDKSSHNFGINLDDSEAAPPEVSHVFIGDFRKLLAEDGWSYIRGSGSYANGGSEDGAQDILIGTEGSDSIFGLGGNDGLEGGDGDDFIDGGSGTDLLLGGFGKDTILGDSGDDYIFGSGNGNLYVPTNRNFTSPDYVYYKPFEFVGAEIARGFSWVIYTPPGVSVKGGEFRNYNGVDVTPWITDPVDQSLIKVESDGNFIDGGSGNDYIETGTGSDTVFGGADNDTIIGLDKNDQLFGEDGDDVIFGDGFTEKLEPYTTTWSADIPWGAHGNDILVGGKGNDYLVGQGKDDELYGGIGNDSMWGDDPDFINTPGEITGKDYLDGEDGNDYLEGGGRDDELFGGQGNDSLWGDSESDKLEASFHGDDYLDGEDGDDQLIGDGGDDELFGGAGNDKIWGDDDLRRLPASQAKGDDYLDGEVGNDTLIGGAGRDTLYGGADDDLLYGDDDSLPVGQGGNDEIYGGLGKDLVWAGEGKDFVDGGDGDDTLNGEKGDDTLLGGVGDDMLHGGDGNDALEGGRGADYLAGEAGDDTYLFAAGDGALDSLGRGDTVDDVQGRNTVVFGVGVSLSGVRTAVNSQGSVVVQYTSTDVLGVKSGLSGAVKFKFGDGQTFTATQLISQTNPTPVIQVLTDGDGVVHVVGSNASETVTVTSHGSKAYGGQGNDSMVAAVSGVDFQYEAGDGADHISAVKDANGTQLNRLTLGEGFGLSSVKLSTSGNSLKITLNDDPNNSAIYVDGFNAAQSLASLTIDQFTFDDGTTLSAADLLNLGLSVGGTNADDVQQGAIGGDQMLASAGNDTLKGGAGGDTYYWAPGSGLDVIDDGGTSAEGVDKLVLNDSTPPSDLVLGKAGNDLLVHTTMGTDSIRILGHFTGNALEQITFADGTVWDAAYIAAHLTNELTEGSDYFNGTTGNDTIFARGGNDNISAKAGDDWVDGGTGNDSLIGEAGNDTLIGGAGNDTLVGGAGGDVYVFGRGGGVDRISESSTDGTIDVLRLEAGISTADVKLTFSGDLTLSIKGTADRISFASPDNASSEWLERIEFADGTVWTASEWSQRALADAATTGNDTIYGFYNTADYIAGGAGNDYLSGNNGDDTLDGGAGDDNLYGGVGNDTLINGETMAGGAGNDTYVLSSWVPVTINEYTEAGANTDTLVLPVAAADVKVYRGYNSSTGDYDDLYLKVPSLSDSTYVIVSKYFYSQNNDYKVETIKFSDGSSWSVSDVFARVVQGFATAGNDTVGGYRWADNIDGLAGNDYLKGAGGNDTLDGGLGDDQLYGGIGDDDLRGGSGGHDLLKGEAGADTYRFGWNSGADVILESGATTAEIDTIALDAGVAETDVSLIQNGTSLLLILGQSTTQLEVRSFFATGTADYKIEQIKFASGVTWNAAQIASRIVSGTVNAMTGTTANDTFNVDNVSDTITEAANAGTDTVVSTVGYTLPSNVENLTITGVLNATLWGNSLNNVLTGNAGNNIFNGKDPVWWNTEWDYSDSGADTMVGGLGDDIYYVTSAFYQTRDSGDDTVVEKANEGNDTVITNTYDYSLSANVENLVSGYNNYSMLDGNGKVILRSLTGNAGNNIIDASAWRQTAVKIDGGTGADTMYGTEESDIYVVDDVGDVVVDSPVVWLTSIDTVLSSVSYTLKSDIENLTLTGGVAINGTGNSKNNVLDGAQNFAANVLSGGAGNDTYYVDQGDTIVENLGEGTDTVIIMGGIPTGGTASVASFANVENMTIGYDASFQLNLAGNSGDNILVGNRGNNDISGGDGNDTLYDGPGRLLNSNGSVNRLQVDNDRLFGGAGDDKLYSKGDGGNDTMDGGTGNDLIYLSSATNSTVVFGRGYGSDVVWYGYSGTQTHVAFNSEVSLADLVLSRSSTDLVMALAGGNDGLTWKNFFSDETSNAITGNLTDVIFADGLRMNSNMLYARLAAGNMNSATDNADLLVGSASEHVLLGYGGNDTIVGSAGADTLDGGLGDDSLQGGLGDDTYQFALGGGHDWVSDTGGVDKIVFDPSITAANVTVVQNGDYVDFMFSGSSDVLSVGGYFGDGTQSIEQVVFADGTLWSASKIVDMTRKVFGTEGADALYGSVGSDSMYGLGGNDSIEGFDGADFLDGGSGVDTLVGGLGDDTYVIDSTSDLVKENAGEGTDTVQSALTLTLGSNLENLMLTGTAAINGTGNTLANVISGNAAANTLSGGAGIDTMIGGAGNDSYLVDNTADAIVENVDEGTDSVSSSATYILSANIENLILTGTAAINGTGNALANTIIGNTGANTLSGDDGDDTINGGTGIDTMNGGLGNDTFVVDNTADVVNENAGEGTDLVQSSATYTLLANVENLTLTGTAAINGTGNTSNNWLVGNSGVNTLTGGAGNDTLDGGAGADSLVGGTGDDLYIVDNASDKAVESTTANEGTDTVQSSVTFTLGTFVENLVLTGTAANNGTGNSSANVITGNAAANTLDGGTGIDTLIGGAGNDSYVVDNTADVVTENLNEGADSVSSSATYTLSANIENLTLTGTATINGTGNALANTITGNTGANTLSGGDGDDTINGGTGIDTMNGGLGNDTFVVDNTADVVNENAGEGTDLVQSSATYTLLANVENLTLTGTAAINGTGNTSNNWLVGNSGVNTLTGGAGNDTLDGGAGADSLVGGTGDDLYIVDNASDKVVESTTANEGTDTVQSSVTFTLGTFVENLILTGTAANNGTGNSSANVITGNAAANTLDGGTGIDTLIGGAGNDSYVVDNTADVVTENLNEGTDTVSSSATYTLSANIENLTLTGTSAINGTGNSLANTITGNTGANTLSGGDGDDTINGGTGIDTMNGGLGNDTFVVDNTADVVNENVGEGTDLVQSSATYTLLANVENLTLTGTGAINGTGNTSNNWLVGNSGVNTLTGGAGNDTLDGGAGADSLVGGTGDDLYIVDNASDKVVESTTVDEGVDTVQSSVTWTLGTFVENLTLTGTGAINGTGNTSNNWLVGNSGVNTLTGGAGNDTLDGGVGADSLVGGTGDDLYVVDNASDKVVESTTANEGTDTVQSSVTWTLGTFVENLTLTGTAAINGTGNTLSNALTGNSGNNTLVGGGGNDTYRGGQGTDILTASVATSNDTYVWGRGEGADTLTDAGGTDLLSILSGVTAEQVWLRHVSNNLELSVIGTTDTFTVANWYTSSANQVESFKLADGKTLTAANVNNLVNAMAAFTPPSAGQTTLPANYQSTLAPTIAANWT